MKTFKVLTVAGSDSGGGAGIQADMRVINSLGGYAASVITAVTAQNTLGIESIFSLPADVVASQLDAVLKDINFDAVKTGMLYTGDIIEVTAVRLARKRIKNLVVDPVTVSKGGNILLKKEAIKLLADRIFPLAVLLTPNIDEASVLAGKKIANIEDAKNAAKDIVRLGAKNVLVKGGHLKGAPVDVLCSGKKIILFEGNRINSKHTHGIGCMFSASIASFLACGYDLNEAISASKKYIEKSLINAEAVGNGISPPDPSGWVAKDAEAFSAINDVLDAFELLKGKGVEVLIPEVQSNIVSVAGRGETIRDVAAFPGRVIKTGNDISVLSHPQMGASSHMARVVLAARKFDKNVAGAMNIKYSPVIVLSAKKLGFDVAEFSRKDEPLDRSKKEGKSLDWGVNSILVKRRKTPDIIFDRGGDGKEPMLRVFGSSAVDAANKVLRIAGKLTEGQAEIKAVRRKR